MQNKIQEKIEAAIQANDEVKLNQLFREILDETISFGAYLKQIYQRKKGAFDPLTETELIEGIREMFREHGMYRLKLETLTFPETMNREEKEKWLFRTYEYKDIARSSKAVMGSIDFLSNTRTLDKKDLKERFTKPVDKVTREELFLFAFGLGLSVEEVTDFIQKYLGEPGFRWKDYKEVIYFWCLRNQDEDVQSIYRGIEGVYHALRYYHKTPIAEYSGMQAEAKTYFYQERAVENGKTDAEFRSYLGMLKNRQPKNGYSVTRSEILKKNLRQLHVWISEENAFHISKFERDLWSCVNPAVQFTMNPIEIKRIGFPSIWRNALIGEKVNSHTRDVTRKDILISRFLYYAFKKEFGKMDDQSELDDYIEIEDDCYNLFDDADEDFEEITDLLEMKESFDAVIGLDLSECGMYEELYLPNPFELFLLLCLQTDVPYSVFMNAWSTAATVS